MKRKVSGLWISLILAVRLRRSVHAVEPIESDASRRNRWRWRCTIRVSDWSAKCAGITPGARRERHPFPPIADAARSATVSFIPLVGLPGLQVLEQQFFYDPASPDILLSRYIGRTDRSGGRRRTA
jgi:hypothetical protein